MVDFSLDKEKNKHTRFVDELCASLDPIRIQSFGLLVFSRFVAVYERACAESGFEHRSLLTEVLETMRRDLDRRAPPRVASSEVSRFIPDDSLISNSVSMLIVSFCLKSLFDFVVAHEEGRDKTCVESSMRAIELIEIIEDSGVSFEIAARLYRLEMHRQMRDLERLIDDPKALTDSFSLRESVFEDAWY